MIALLDYGAGNLASVRKALLAVGADFYTPWAPGDVLEATGIIVPGVGHFATAAALDDGWRDAVTRRVLAGTPLFGICLGMQWLYEGSDEAPGVAGLGMFAGRVKRLDAGAEGPAPRGAAVKVPHVGWNTLEIVSGARILRGVSPGTHMYFTHSYAAPVTPEAAAVTTHASPFAAAVEKGQLFGVQFHPEKSGEAGLRILRNFVELSCSPSA